MGTLIPKRNYLLVCFFLILSTAANASKLEDARAEWNANRPQEAIKIYDEIKFNDPDWIHKLVDAYRLQYSKGNYADAWRMTQVARRAGKTTKDLDYYEALAAIQAGSCAAYLPVERESWHDLLLAHIYRYAQKFRNNGYRASPMSKLDDQVVENHLQSKGVHYLKDIPKAELIPKKGCWWIQSRLRETKRARGFEAEALKRWADAEYWNTPAEKRMAGSDEVILRLFTITQKDEEVKEKLLGHFSGFTEAQWLTLDAPTRQFVWNKLVIEEALPPMPMVVTDPHSETVFKIMTQSNDTSALNWLGAVNFMDWSDTKKLFLIDHLLTIPGIDKRAYLTLYKAEILFRKGKNTDALNLVRQILIEGENEIGEDIEDAAVKIALAIFREYRYDEKILGAIQSSLPVRLWSQAFRELFISQSLAGNQRGAQLLLSTIKNKKTALRMREQDLEFLDLLMKRNLNGIRRFFDVQKARLRGFAYVQILRDVATQAIALDEAELKKLDPFFLLIANHMSELIMAGRNAEELNQLHAIYDRLSKRDWSKGSNTVKKGTIQAGVIDLEKPYTIPNPFKWEDPDFPEPKPLVVQPVSITGRDWQIR